MADKVTDYKVLKATDPDALAKLVISFLSKGWELYGGISVTSSFNRVYYAQAIIKREEH